MDRSTENILSSLQNILNQAKEPVAIAEAVVHPAESCRNRAERMLLLCQDLVDSTKADNIAISFFEIPRDDTTSVIIPKIFALFPTPKLGWRFIKIDNQNISTFLHLNHIKASVTTIILCLHSTILLILVKSQISKLKRKHRLLSCFKTCLVF